MTLAAICEEPAAQPALISDIASQLAGTVDERLADESKDLNPEIARPRTEQDRAREV